MKCDKCGAPVKYREQHSIGLSPVFDVNIIEGFYLTEILVCCKCEWYGKYKKGVVIDVAPGRCPDCGGSLSKLKDLFPELK